MLGGKSAFSIEILVRFNNASSGYIYSENPIGAENDDKCVNISVTSSAVYYYTTNASGDSAFNYRGSLSGWNHVVLTWGGGRKEVYVNGVLTDSWTSNNHSIANSDNVALFRHTVKDDVGFTGDMQYLRLYDKRLNSDEISDLYENGNDDASKYTCFECWDLRTIDQSTSLPAIILLNNTVDGGTPVSISGITAFGQRN